jgi:hypothetical protein
LQSHGSSRLQRGFDRVNLHRPTKEEEAEAEALAVELRRFQMADIRFLACTEFRRQSL